MKKIVLTSVSLLMLLQLCACQAMDGPDGHVSDKVIAKQRMALAQNTAGKGFGPQSPRDIDSPEGRNGRAFGVAPPHTKMSLCNIHFHKSAEHKGGEFTTYAGNSDGDGYHSGYRYSGKLTEAEREPFTIETKHGVLASGDTIEVHFVYTTADCKPGPTLGSCLSDSIDNPQLRVEALVCVLVNGGDPLDFRKLTEIGQENGLYQAVNIPNSAGTPIQYAGSTTGPSYNEKGSPYQVTWSVRPKVVKVHIETVAEWLEGNVFEEDHAHGVRNLVINPALLSKMDR
ncbi:MAG: hypothetical protein GY930_13660 [bacterium]|nr:hypothetical protein [bacterium]